MKTWIRKSLKVGVLSAGLLLFAASSAQAGTTQVSQDNDGVLNGTQLSIPVQIPINACNLGIGAVLGIGAGVGQCSNGTTHDIDLDGDDDNLKPVHTAPADTDDPATSDPAATDPAASGRPHHHHHGPASQADPARRAMQRVGLESSYRTEGATQVSQDNDGVLNGTQAYVPIQIPVNLCNIGIGAVLGVGAGVGQCSNGTTHDIDAGDGSHRNGHGTVQSAGGSGVQSAGAPGRRALRQAGLESSRTEGATQVSSDNDGVLNGTQAYVPIQVPINVCNIGVGAVLGVGAGVGQCSNGSTLDIGDPHSKGKRADGESARTEGITQASNDNDGLLNGTQIAIPIQVPINLCQIGVGVLGVGAGVGQCSNGATHDIDLDGDDDVAKPDPGPQGPGAGDPHGHHPHKDGDKAGRGHDGYGKTGRGHDGYGKESTEALPTLPGLTALSSLTGAGGLVPTDSLGGGLKSTKMNLAGVDPTQALGALGGGGLG